MESIITIQNFKCDHAKIREICSHVVLIHELPFNFAENDNFNLLMMVESPHFQKISHTTAKKVCVTSYKVNKKKVKALLVSAIKVSVTTDLWKSGQKISYMVLTYYFIDSKWQLQKHILNVCEMFHHLTLVLWFVMWYISV